MRTLVHIGKFHWERPGGIESYVRSSIGFFKSDFSFQKIYHIYFSDIYRFNEEEIRQGSKTCRLINIGVPTLIKLRSTPIPFFTSEFRKAIRSIRADVVHFHHPNPTMHPVWGWIRKQNPNAKLVVHYHSDIEKQKILRKFYGPFLHRLMRQADKIAVTSPQYARSSPVLKNYLEKCAVNPFGTVVPIRSEIPRQDFRIRLLSVGRLVSYKGFEFLVRAMSLLKELNIELRLVGIGPLERELKNLADELNVSSKIQFLGNLSTEELALEYQHSDIFVLPSVSRAEAFGIAILEAMSYGKPIITTRLGTGTEHLVEHQVNGLTVPPADSTELANAIRLLATNTALRTDLGQGSLARVQNQFLEEHHFSRIKEVYGLSARG